MSKRTYKKNRRSNAGKTRYEVYQQKRRDLMEQGYTLDEGLSESEFNEVYDAAQKRHDKNITRTIAREDIVFTRTKREKRIIPELQQAGISYDDVFTESGRSKMSRKELYDFYANAAKRGAKWAQGGKLEKSMTRKVKDNTKRGWHYLWEEDFYRGSVFY